MKHLFSIVSIFLTCSVSAQDQLVNWGHVHINETANVHSELNNSVNYHYLKVKKSSSSDHVCIVYHYPDPDNGDKRQVVGKTVSHTSVISIPTQLKGMYRVTSKGEASCSYVVVKSSIEE